jgi:seryl-tRNA synthetase
MIDIKLLREKPDLFRKGTTDKNRDASIVDKVLAADEVVRGLKKQIDDSRSESNQIANEMAKKKDESLIKKGKELKESVKKTETELKTKEVELNSLLWQIPNPAFPDVPVGKDESGNVEVRKWGEPTKLDFPAKDHLSLGESLKIIDFESGAKVAGSQFYFLLNEGAMLEVALVQFAQRLLSKEGFTPVITPDLAKSRYYLGTGYVPVGNEAQTYTIGDEDLGLIATAEVTLAGRHADEAIPEQELPIKYIGYSHCFRREAGAYGRYSKGLYRVHQFTKAEIFIYCLPEESEQMHQLILSMEEKIYQELKIPYRVVQMCTGDLGGMAARKYDIEAWMPGRGDYGEVTSTSNCTDYQARNLNIKVRRKNGTVEHLHMLNGTAIATSRTLIAILENYQQKDGTVLIPEALQSFTGFNKIDFKK